MGYISKEDAINAAIDAVDDWDGGWVHPRAAEIEKYIKDVPDADVVERRRGNWMYDSGMHRYFCSRCRKYEYEYSLAPYCRWCGADMGGEENEKTNN